MREKGSVNLSKQCEDWKPDPPFTYGGKCGLDGGYCSVKRAKKPTCDQCPKKVSK